MIDEVLVAPLAGAVGLLPASPDVQESDEVTFSNSKPAQHCLVTVRGLHSLHPVDELVPGDLVCGSLGCMPKDAFYVTYRM